MVFNWFRRQFDKTEETPEQQPQADLVPEQVTEETSPPEEQASAVAEDYLSWAKAAYKNIQKQQQTTATEAETPTTETEATETQETPTVEPPAPTETSESEPAPTETATASEETPALITAEVEQVETEVGAGSSLFMPPTNNLDKPAPTEPAPALPFWAKAEADRLERMERLKADAVEIIEPEPARSTPQMLSEEELAMLAFDEGFLWSAEILAAQGRRPDDVSIEEITWLKKLRQGLDKTRRNLINQLRAIVGQGPLNQAGVIEIESLLLQADVGVAATDFIINALQTKLREEALPPEKAIAYLKQILREMLERPTGKALSVTFAPVKEELNIWLIVGVNGAGKTTTIGKIAHLADKSGYKTLIAAADTFRAAAVQQVKVWGSRSNVEVIANPGQNTDPAAVVFDAIAAAQARGTELLLVDTAGRLQNKKNLMDELSKVRRIIEKKAPNAKVESLLVLDSTLGQNGLRQAEVFGEAAQLSGVILTKLDGTAKGGIALAVVQELGLPVRFIGAGEGIEDLRPFSSYEFVEALLSG